MIYKIYKTLLFTTKIEAQRRVGQMRVIVLRPWAHYRAFVVVVILITNIPIEPIVQLDRQTRFRCLVTHRIRSDQRSRPAGRIGHPISLAVVLIDSISREQRRAWSNARHRLYKEEIIPHNVQAISQRVLHTIEEIVDDRLTVDPMIVVASADGEPRSRGPIK